MKLTPKNYGCASTCLSDLDMYNKNDVLSSQSLQIRETLLHHNPRLLVNPTAILSDQYQVIRSRVLLFFYWPLTISIWYLVSETNFLYRRNDTALKEGMVYRPLYLPPPPRPPHPFPNLKGSCFQLMFSLI